MKSSDKNGAFFLLQKPAILFLKNGLFFKGKSIGSQGTAIGELCFNTGMVGYQEILTDPSYKGQIINMTYPHIGNYGTNEKHTESNKIHAEGLIVREVSRFPSNHLASDNLDHYLNKNNVIGIEDIDTRNLTRTIRDEGAMNAIISSEIFDKKILLEKLNNAPDMLGLNLSESVTCKEIYKYKKNSNFRYTIIVIDYGVKKNILNLLNSRNCNVIVVPSNICAKDIIKLKPDGILLSNGPGDPASSTKSIQCIKSLLGLLPIFGICLGHQLLAIALGARTYKLKYGHRGINHPVKNLLTGKVEITSQNHGFSISKKNIPKDIKISHINLNDDTIAGIICKKYNAFSVQYHPESNPGPNDSTYLFDEFINSVKSYHEQT